MKVVLQKGTKQISLNSLAIWLRILTETKLHGWKTEYVPLTSSFIAKKEVASLRNLLLNFRLAEFLRQDLFLIMPRNDARALVKEMQDFLNGEGIVTVDIQGLTNEKRA